MKQHVLKIETIKIQDKVPYTEWLYKVGENNFIGNFATYTTDMRYFSYKYYIEMI